LKFYADVHRSKRNGEGCRITYTTDGITFKHVDSFSPPSFPPPLLQIMVIVRVVSHGRKNFSADRHQIILGDGSPRVFQETALGPR
jgi:hypothetical protein